MKNTELPAGSVINEQDDYKDIDSGGFKPFYDRLAPSALSKWIVCIILGLIFSLPYWWVLGNRLFFLHYGWTLGVMISLASGFQFYATATFRNTLPQMQARLDGNHDLLLRSVNRFLGNKNFLLWGLFFAILNTIMGLIFGLPSEYHVTWTSILLSYCGFFLVGFACGMPACGIFGVWQTIRTFAGYDMLQVDDTALDGCGGMQFLGESLLKFASVTLVMGVWISLYILCMNWSNSAHKAILVIRWLWIIWPFFLSMFVFFAPGIPLHRSLEKWKQKRDDEIHAKLIKIKNEIDRSRPLPPEHLLSVYEHYESRLRSLQKMHTWPYDFTSQVNYAGVVFVNCVVVATSVVENSEKLKQI